MASDCQQANFLSRLGHDPLEDFAVKQKKTVAATKKKKEDFFSSRSAPETSNEVDDTQEWERIKESFRIYFPTAQTVESSRGGRQVSFDE